MPGTLAPLIGFVLGATFAWAEGSAPGRPTSVRGGGRGLLVVAIFSALVFAPVAGYFISFASDWSFAYLVDTAQLSPVFDLSLVLACVVSVPSGFAAARSTRYSIGRFTRVVAIPAILVGGALVAALPRLGVFASYAQYHGDFGVRSVAGSSLGYALLWMDAVLVAGALVTIRSLRAIASTRPRRANDGPGTD